MTSNGIAKRRGVSNFPGLPRTPTAGTSRAAYSTPPASRSSEPVYQSRTADFEEEVRWDEQAQSFDHFGSLLSEQPERYQYDATFFQVDENEAERSAADDVRHTGRHGRQRSRDDYGVAYSRYQDRDGFSPPRTPEDDTVSLDWDSTFDPFTSACFRRGSLVLDPAAFDSTPSINTLPPAPPQSPGGNAALKLKRSTEALKDFGRKVLPRLKIKTRNSFQADQDLNFEFPKNIAKTTPSPSTQQGSYSSSGRTRSNTLESSRSIRSRTSTSNLASILTTSEPLSREHLQDSSDVLSPLATYRHLQGQALGLPFVPAEAQPSPVSMTSRNYNTPSSVSPAISTTGLASVVEKRSLHAPPIRRNSQLTGATTTTASYTATDAALEEIMRLMQEEDDAFAATEASMIRSGWSSEGEIDQVRQRRQEHQNLWQRKLDDALDQAKAQVNLD